MGASRLRNLLHKDLNLFKQLGIVLLMMSLTRIVFFIANYQVFTKVVFFDFVGGVWIDMITIGIYFIPFYVLFLLPLPFFKKKWYQIGLQVIFNIISVVVIALNLMDVEYYKYTSKRSTIDLFTIITAGEDFKQLIGTFILEFWWLIFLLFAIIYFANWLYKKTLNNDNYKYYFPFETLNFIVFVALLLFIGRGGFTLRPADMLTASRLTTPQKVGLVANTPLSIIKSIGKESLSEKNFFPENSPNIYSPIHHGNTAHQLSDGEMNVMLIILESFGDEWLGKKNGKEFTPFLDSLLDESLYFDNAFANGKKSIESLPSIFAAIPSLFDNPYISSQYETNTITSLTSVLKKEGYSSAFYHGATNGSMKFDVFTAHLEFDHYFGRREYNNDAHSDKTWGILDEYFLPWTANSITKELKEPFIASLFTLSSHHPYFVPEEHKETLPKGEHPMGQSIAYADMSLKMFFEEAKKQPWYENTLFVITADHTPTGVASRFSQRIGMYQIPIAFYHPSGKIKAKQEDKMFNQIDILPTVLDYLGYSKDVYSFGNSYFSKREPFSINYIENTYIYFKGDYMINFVEDHAVNLYNYKIDTMMYHDSITYYPDLVQKMEKEVKGFIQRYNHDLINNSMVIE